MSTVARTYTAEDLWNMPGDQRRELVRGEMRTMAPSGFDHGAIITNIALLLGTHVKQNSLGVVLGAETGYVLARNPDVVRGADVSFVSASRIPQSGRPKKFWEGAPDLAVEVLSPNDSAEEIGEKVDDYLRAGTALVWVVNPRLKTVSAHRSDGSSTTVRAGDVVTGDDVVPGFSCKVDDIFT